MKVQEPRQTNQIGHAEFCKQRTTLHISPNRHAAGFGSLWSAILFLAAHFCFLAGNEVADSLVPPFGNLEDAALDCAIPLRIIVKPALGASLKSLDGLNALFNCRLLHRLPALGGLEILEAESGRDAASVLLGYQRSGLVEYAELDQHVRLTETFPGDPAFMAGSLWPLYNPDRGLGPSDADIDAPRAWDLLTGAPDIVVALLDTGVRYTHEDLAPNMWTNPLDGSHGFNALTGKHDPLDDNGHGTLMAGIIGAVGNNGVGVVGVAWSVKIMACKFVNEKGDGLVSNAILALEFARENGAKIINSSWIFDENSRALSDAIAEARATGIIVVAAAGNAARNVDQAPFYPACFPHDNIVSVAASTRTDSLSFFSNFGETNVDLAAPGGGVLSTASLSDHSYAVQPPQGESTSIATAYVSGSLALMLTAFPTEGYLQIIQRLFQATDPLPSLEAKCVTGGRLNLRKALGLSKVASPRISLEPSVGGVSLQVTGSPGYLHVIQTSSNLVDWASIYTNAMGDLGSLSLESVPVPKGPGQFFRAIVSP